MRRGIKNRDVLRLYNERGACLAGARLADGIRHGVVQLATGVWFGSRSPRGGSRGEGQVVDG
ncbi:hypothetical protein KM427_01045 [Nocardioides sp. LMS-CY]|nr:hypothetical protein KM427_01045 [Nocardioides sp. LMS-CY]